MTTRWLLSDLTQSNWNNNNPSKLSWIFDLIFDSNIKTCKELTKNISRIMDRKINRFNKKKILYDKRVVVSKT